MYYNTESLRQAKRKNSMVYLTLAQKKEVMKLVNDAGLILLEFYLAKANVPQYEYRDDKTALALGWTVRKVQDTRRKLESKDLFSQEVYGSGTRKAVITKVAERFTKGYNKQEVDAELIEDGSYE